MNLSPDPTTPDNDAADVATAVEPTPSLLDAAWLQFPEGQKKWLRNRLKYLCRCALDSGASRQWLTFLSQPRLKPLFHSRPRLARKLHYPYLCADWRISQRLHALRWHYTICRDILHRSSLASIYSDRGLDLVRIQRSDAPDALLLRLENRDQFAKEGDLTLTVADRASGLSLATITFSLIETGGKRTLVIGGLQGSGSPQAAELIRRVAKKLFGLRAKSLALWAVQELARYWAVEAIFAVGGSQHIYRGTLRNDRVAATYDAFWAESGGSPTGGLWRLPLEMHSRSRAELKPSRRLEHERRYRFLSDLHPKLLTAAIHAGPARSFSEKPAHGLEVLYFTPPEREPEAEQSASSRLVCVSNVT